jgi:hypothetical protein
MASLVLSVVYATDATAASTIAGASGATPLEPDDALLHKYGTDISMPTDGDASAMSQRVAVSTEALNEELRRALTVLARHNDGCPEAELLAEGFSVDQLSLLTLDGLTKSEMRPIDVGGQKKSVIWARIMEAGRKAIAP